MKKAIIEEFYKVAKEKKEYWSRRYSVGGKRKPWDHFFFWQGITNFIEAWESKDKDFGEGAYKEVKELNCRYFPAVIKNIRRDLKEDRKREYEGFKIITKIIDDQKDGSIKFIRVKNKKYRVEFCDDSKYGFYRVGIGYVGGLGWFEWKKYKSLGKALRGFLGLCKKYKVEGVF